MYRHLGNVRQLAADMTTVSLTIEVSDCICWSIVYIYVVAAVIRCGVWEEVDTPVHAAEGVMSLLMQHSWFP